MYYDKFDDFCNSLYIAEEGLITKAEFGAKAAMAQHRRRSRDMKLKSKAKNTIMIPKNLFKPINGYVTHCLNIHANVIQEFADEKVINQIDEEQFNKLFIDNENYKTVIGYKPTGHEQTITISASTLMKPLLLMSHNIAYWESVSTHNYNGHQREYMKYYKKICQTCINFIVYVINRYSI